MSDSLADKLKSLGVTLGARNIAPEAKHCPIDQVMDGEYQSTIYGEIFVRTQFYPDNYIHGQNHLRSSSTCSMMAEWGRVPRLNRIDPELIYFLDTETSGLAGGTGTFAFLIGVGHYTAAGFHLAQFFLRDPAEESALLAALVTYLHGCKVLVTFNGKNFDAPLLNTRYTLQGLTSPVKGLDHLDLLHLARRLWRDRLPSRALGYLEESILRVSRTQEEVPGWMVPELYFEYLRTHDARPLQGVFYHNSMDILSLAALFSHTTGLLEDPLSRLPQPGLDLVSLAKLYEDLGHPDTAVRLYEAGLEFGLPDEFVWTTIERFSMLYKRRHAWREALTLWQKASENRQLYGFIESAKYYEHEANDLPQAILWTRAAINLVNQSDFPSGSKTFWLANLQHRLERLLKKVSANHE